MADMSLLPYEKAPDKKCVIFPESLASQLHGLLVQGTEEMTPVPSGIKQGFQSSGGLDYVLPTVPPSDLHFYQVPR